MAKKKNIDEEELQWFLRIRRSRKKGGGVFGEGGGGGGGSVTPVPPTPPSSFTPTDLTPTIWYNSDATKMASDGSLWSDTMLNYDVTASLTARPTYNATALNGRPGFVFNGIANVLAGTRVTQLQAQTKFAIWSVMKRGTITHDPGLATSLSGQLHFPADDTFYPAINNPGNNFGSFASTNAFHYSILLYDGTQATNALKLILIVDGVARTLAFTGTIPTSTENNASSTIRIGLYGGSLFVAGTSCEFGVVTGRVITAGEITSLNTYLAATYGL